MSTPSLDGRLSVVPNTNLSLFESGAIGSPNAVIFVGGLGDGLGTLGYLYGLSEALGKEGWTLVHTLLSTSYSQFGVGTLEQDARELGQIVDYLRNERGKQKLVLLGHSTGCQDAMQYVTVNGETRPKIDGAVLQAPVSDVDYFDKISTTEAKKWVATAEQMVAEGKGNEWLPRDASLSLVEEGRTPVPFTAYRFASLYARRGDDDFFSVELEEPELKFSLSVAPLLLLLGDEDEAYGPALASYDAKVSLLQKWTRVAHGKVSRFSRVLEGANHQVINPSARHEMFSTILAFISAV